MFRCLDLKPLDYLDTLLPDNKKMTIEQIHTASMRYQHFTFALNLVTIAFDL